MAFYDPKTDSIVGCEENSYVWFHEQRHRKQYNSGWANRVDVMFIFLYYVSFIVLLWGFFSNNIIKMLIILGVLYLPYLLSLLFFELDAYVNGFFDWLNYKEYVKFRRGKV